MDQLPRRHSDHADQILTERVSLRVLIVDDNTDAAELLCILLQQLGHQVRTAHDGPSGIELARHFRPNVILLDVGLPLMDGYLVAQQLRKEPELRSTMLVALTGYGQPDDLRRSESVGFDFHLLKPVGMDALERVLAEAERLTGKTRQKEMKSPLSDGQ